LLAAYGRLMFVTGEGTLFGRNLNTPEERWSFLWNDEVAVETGSDGQVKKITHKVGAGGKSIDYGPNEAVAYRMWAPHPRLSSEADAPMRSVLDIAEELIILTASVRSTAVTRLTNGIMFLPEEASFAPPEPTGDEDPLADPFMADWADHLSAQVENPGLAEARVPFIVRMHADLIEVVKHEKVHDPSNDYMERDLRKEAVDRLALGLDMPREILRGVGQANHWVARSIMADLWPSHGHPVGTQFATDLNEVYLRPSLKEENFDRWEEVVIGIDASAVEILTDPSDDADRAFDRGAIFWRGYRKMKNIPDDYAMTDEEFEKWLIVKSPRATAVGGEGATSPDSRPAEEGPPLPGAEGDSGRRSRVVGSAALELGAALTALARCREVAGARLRQKAIRGQVEAICPECEEQPLGLAAVALGEERLKRLKIDPLSLVRGGSDHLRAVLLSQGWAAEGADGFCSIVEMHAARTLCEAELPVLPESLEMQIQRMREAA